MKNIILVLATLLIGLSSCKKDEETKPQVNKDDLLCRTWQLDKEYIDGEESLPMMNIDYEYKKDGTGTAIIYFVQSATVNFEWRWVDNKKNIEINLLDPKSKSDWDKVEIIVLTENELIIEQLIGDRQYRMEFTEK